MYEYCCLVPVWPLWQLISTGCDRIKSAAGHRRQGAETSPYAQVDPVRIVFPVCVGGTKNRGDPFAMFYWLIRRELQAFAARCDYATDLCREVQPAEGSEGHHMARCFVPLWGKPSAIEESR